MDEGTFGLILLFAIGTIISIISHTFSRAFIATSTISALIASLIYCVVSWLHEPDAMILIAFIMGSILCFAISIVVGIPFFLVRKKKDKHLTTDKRTD